MYVWSKHFREDELAATYKFPNGDATYPIFGRLRPRTRPKLKDRAISTILPGCSSYYPTHSSAKRSHLSLEDKDDKLLKRAVSLSLESGVEERRSSKFTVSRYII
ncbi:hypothetical protein LOD99_591 [Oopsacas minuta]|uniref:Uncharacterized protein n=1 Tax=Oopsacas minuta TaxID=111878 RepID=A0AAV7KB53_9METZ|nr:hypothetical protein LOD99_591 [Oopsacas minuta]